VQCLPRHVNVNGTCIKCSYSDLECPIATKFTSNCTAQNKGCLPCTEPKTQNWCWTSGSICAWDCLKNYRKISGQCQFDSLKNWNPYCIVFPSIHSQKLEETSATPLFVLTTSTHTTIQSTTTIDFGATSSSKSTMPNWVIGLIIFLVFFLLFITSLTALSTYRNTKKQSRDLKGKYHKIELSIENNI